ncbi:AN1-type zinc finger protein 1 [Rhodotorula kratochvilovae]
MSAPPPTDTGEHCALASCKQADFLPLQCPHCAQRLCGAHVAPSAHLCPVDPAQRSLSPAELEASRAEGARTGPELRDLLPDPKRHKREEQGMSEEERARRARQQAALDKFRQVKGRGKDSPPAATASQPVQPRKLNPALELARLKGRAAPLDPKHVKRPGDVPMPDRLFMKVQYGQEDAVVREVWAAKSVSAGKALDLLSDTFKVTNENNVTKDPSKLLSLALPGDPLTRVDLAKPLKEQVANGGSVLLLKGHVWP